MRRFLKIQLIVQLILLVLFIPVYLSARIDTERYIATNSCLLDSDAISIAFTIVRNLSLYFLLFAAIMIGLTLYALKRMKKTN